MPTQAQCDEFYSLGGNAQMSPINAPASVTDSLLLYEWLIVQEEQVIEQLVVFLETWIAANGGTGN